MTDGPESRHRVAAARLIGRAIDAIKDRWRREKFARCDSLRVEMLGWKPGDEWKYPSS